MSGLADTFLKMHAPARAASGSAAPPPLPAADFAVLVVLPSNAARAEFDQAIAGLEGLAKTGKKFRALFSWNTPAALDIGALQRRLAVQSVFPHPDGPASGDFLRGLRGIAAPHLPLFEMARIAALLPDSILSSMILEALAHGIPVYALAAPHGALPAAFAREARELEKRLENLGVRFTTAAELAAQLEGGAVAARPAPQHVAPAGEPSRWQAAPPLATTGQPCPIEGGRGCDDCGRCHAFGF